MARLIPVLKARFNDANGDPLAGGKLYSYVAGSTTPTATYTDQDAGTENANPIVLDANGEADVWLTEGSNYKFVLTDADDVTQWTVDEVTAPGAGADGNTLRSGAGAPAAALGADGDFYIDTVAKTWYGPKAMGAWPAGTDFVSDIDLAAEVTGILPLANGGTGAATKAAAFDALSPMTTGGDLIYGGASGTGTRLANGTAGKVLTSAGTTLAPIWEDAAVNITSLALNKLAATTASRALVSDASGFVSPATTTATEIGYVGGVTSAIQTQLNTKQATITGAATSIVTADLTVSRALVSDGVGKVAVTTTTAAEIGYVGGVTSAIQTQLDSKVLKSILAVKGDIYAASAASTPVSVAVGTDGQVLTADAASTPGVKWSNPPSAPTYVVPKVTAYITGSGTFNITGSPIYIKVRLVGAGGGASGSGGGAPGAGGAGASSSFGTSLLTAAGGAGASAGSLIGGLGGTCTINAPAIALFKTTGGAGGSGVNSNAVLAYFAGGTGGNSFLGGGGNSAAGSSAVTNSPANTGGGGGGSGIDAASGQYSGSGGGAGGYIEAIIVSPSASYAYDVGVGGNGGAAGTSGRVSGAGGSGYIVIEEFYQ